jgi:hypothetical protein
LITSDIQKYLEENQEAFGEFVKEEEFEADFWEILYT